MIPKISSGSFYKTDSEVNPHRTARTRVSAEESSEEGVTFAPKISSKLPRQESDTDELAGSSSSQASAELPP